MNQTPSTKRTKMRDRTISAAAIKGCTESHNRARILSEITGISPRTCRSYIRTLPKHTKTPQLFQELATKDRRKTTVKQFLNQFNTWYTQNHTEPAFPPIQPHKLGQTNHTQLNDHTCQNLVATKQLAKSFGGYENLKQAITILEQLE